VGEGKFLPTIGKEHAPVPVKVHCQPPCSLAFSRLLQKGAAGFLLTSGLNKRPEELQGFFVYENKK
jgi:hypothetical protein